MRTLIYLLLVLLAASCTNPPDTAPGDSPSLFMLVRHTEKDTIGNDPDLSAAGQVRAKALANLLAGTSIDAIYSTDFRRTRQTVDPIAQMQGLSISDYNPRELEAFAEQLLQQYSGRNVLVAGHSNTTPALLNLLTNSSKYTDFAENDYGDLYLVFCLGNVTRVTQLHFGE